MNDIPTNSDSIGFRSHVLGLAQFLTNKRTVPPLTVSIEGEWGTGKSSFMAQLADAIIALSDARASQRDKRTPRVLRKLVEAHRRRRNWLARPFVVRFNAWRHDRDEALWASFALEFARSVRGALPPWSRLKRNVQLAKANASWNKIKPFLLKFGAIGVVLGLLGGYVYKSLFVLKSNTEPSSIEAFANYLEYVWKLVLGMPIAVILLGALERLFRNPIEVDLEKQRPVAAYEQRIGFLERFHEDFRKFVNIYVGVDDYATSSRAATRRAFVLVDDLDRCELSRAAELLQAIHLMLPEGAPVVMVVAMDRRKIAAGIAARHQEILPLLANSEALPTSTSSSALTYGYRFVEKFVQLPLRIPRLASDVLPAFIDHVLRTSARTDALPQESTERDDANASDVVDRDESQVREVILMVAAALEHNPRRIKQFLNLFRLRCRVAENMGELQTPSTSGWTLQQLGKVVAIELCWPVLFDDALANPGLLEELWSHANELVGSPRQPGGWLEPWLLPPVVELMRVTDSARPDAYSLAGVAKLVRRLYGAWQTRTDQPIKHYEGRPSEGGDAAGPPPVDQA